jgi:cell division GTPase FtsZ
METLFQLEENDRYKIKVILFDKKIHLRLARKWHQANLVELTYIDSDATLEDELVSEELKEFDMVLIVVAGTGIVVAQQIATIAKKYHNLLTVAVISLPLFLADKASTIEAFSQSVDSSIIIPLDELLIANDELLELLARIVESLCNPIVQPGLMCIDFLDIRVIFEKGKRARVGFGSAETAYQAALQAFTSQFLGRIDWAKIGGVLINIVSDASFRIEDFQTIFEVCETFINEDAIIVASPTIEGSSDEIRVTVIAV